MKVLCFGSLNIDYTYKVDHFVKKGETLSSGSLQVFSGGKGLNQSIALARAGAETYHAGSIGEDGRFLLEQLQDAGVDTRYVTVLETVRTGNAIIQNDKEGDNCILLYGGANQAVTTNQADAVLEHFRKGDFLVLQNEINELAYIMERAHERGMKIVLNPSPMDENWDMWIILCSMRSRPARSSGRRREEQKGSIWQKAFLTDLQIPRWC